MLLLTGSLFGPGRRPDESGCHSQTFERQPEPVGIHQTGFAQVAQRFQRGIGASPDCSTQVHEINDLIVLAPDEEASEQAAGDAAWNHVFSVSCSGESLSSF